MGDGVLNHNSERILHIYIKFNCNIYTLKDFSVFFLIDFFADITPMAAMMVGRQGHRT